MNKTTDKATRAIVEEANRWLVRLQNAELNSHDTAAFSGWLRQSPIHVREYLRAESIWNALAGIDPDRQIDIDRLISGNSSNIVELNPAGAGHQEQDLARKQPKWRAGAVAGALATAAMLILAIASNWYLGQADEQIYKTNRGEQRRVVLQDGSVVEMNTQTEINVVQSEQTRRIDLIDGEALFTVAKDPNRPFIVTSNESFIRAVGTQFNVYRRPGRLLVTVLEGRVSIEDKTQKNGSAIYTRPIELEPGDRVEIMPNTPTRKTEANTLETIAWRDYRLIFEDRLLSEVADEFNRYNQLQIIVRDPELAGQRISAVFDANQPLALIGFLTASASVEATFNDKSQVVLNKSEPK